MATATYRELLARVARLSDAKRLVANRWVIAAAGVLMLIPPGATAAWSLFERPLLRGYYPGQIDAVTLTFTIGTLALGVFAFLGGVWMTHVGSRVVGVVGGVLYGLGIFLAAFSGHHLVLLYLTYGLMSGAGAGLAYIVPVATLLKWFPDKRGLVSGIGVAGFGAGALLVAPLVTRVIIAWGVLDAFGVLGLLYGAIVAAMALAMVHPPAGYAPHGWSPSSVQLVHRSTRHYTLSEALRTWQWYVLLAILLLGGMAGLALLSQAAPLAAAETGANLVRATEVVSLIAIPNALGRILWPWLSDFIGPRWVYLLLFLLQFALLLLLPLAHTFLVFTLLAGALLLCYGGVFGTMPTFVADYFGDEHVGQIYGLLLAPIGLAALVGPWLLANSREHSGSYTPALALLAVVLLASAALPWLVRPPQPHPASVEADRGGARERAMGALRGIGGRVRRVATERLAGLRSR